MNEYFIELFTKDRRKQYKIHKGQYPGLNVRWPADNTTIMHVRARNKNEAIANALNILYNQANGIDTNDYWSVS